VSRDPDAFLVVVSAGAERDDTGQRQDLLSWFNAARVRQERHAPFASSDVQPQERQRVSGRGTNRSQ
jgi:hypothetical protein